MPRLLFLVNLLEHGSYRCHARVRFDSAQELNAFLAQPPLPEPDGWSCLMHRGPERGYDKKPLHEADIWLSTWLPPPVPPAPSQEPDMEACQVHEGTPVPSHSYGPSPASGNPAHVLRRDHLTWEERTAFQQTSKALLHDLGVTDLGPWR